MSDAAPAALASRRPHGPRHDPLIAANPASITWVLLQTKPRLRVLATCFDRARLSREMAELVRIWTDDARTEITRAFLIKPANTLA